MDIRIVKTLPTGFYVSQTLFNVEAKSSVATLPIAAVMIENKSWIVKTLLTGLYVSQTLFNVEAKPSVATFQNLDSFLHLDFSCDA